MVGASVAGRFELAEQTGQSAVSATWRARDVQRDRDVTLELVRGDGVAASRRLDEGLRTLARVESPNVARILGRGTAEDGRLYLVYERAPGEDLRHRLEREAPLALAPAIAIALQMSNGLAAAHAKRLAHAALEPEAVLLAGDGRVLLSGFGVATALGAPGSTLAASAMHGGAYLSPEEAAGDTGDTRSDIYVLGVMLFEMIAGEPPFSTAGAAETAAGHASDAAPALADRGVRPPPGLEALVASCLAREPGLRPSAEVLRDALAAMLALLARDPRHGGDERVVVAALALAEAEPTMVVEAPHAELAPWDEITPPSLELAPEREPMTSAPYRVPASARADAGLVRWIAVTALGLALLVFALILAFTHGNDASKPATTTSAAVVATTSPATSTAGSATTATVAAPRLLAVDSIATFDPKGDGSENDEAAPSAVDGDPGTFWESEPYNQLTDLSQTKGGVGLVLTLAGRTSLRGVEIDTPAPGFSVAIYTSVLASSPTTLDGWTRALSERLVTSSRQVLRLASPRPARFVLLWFTKLVRASAGGDKYSVRIGEARPLGG